MKEFLFHLESSLDIIKNNDIGTAGASTRAKKPFVFLVLMLCYVFRIFLAEQSTL